MLATACGHRQERKMSVILAHPARFGTPPLGACCVQAITLLFSQQRFLMGLNIGVAQVSTTCPTFTAGHQPTLGLDGTPKLWALVVI